MEPILIVLISLLISSPFVLAYLYLYRRKKRRKRVVWNPYIKKYFICAHVVFLILTVLLIILEANNILFRWGMGWFIVLGLIVSGIVLYLASPKQKGIFFLGKLYAAVYYWGTALIILFFIPIALLSAFMFGRGVSYEDEKFLIYDKSLGCIEPIYHRHQVYEKKGPFLVEFGFVGGAIKGGETSKDGSLHLHLEILDTSIEEKTYKDTTVIVRRTNK